MRICSEVRLSSFWQDKLFVSSDTELDTDADIFVKSFTHSGALDPLNRPFPHRQQK